MALVEGEQSPGLVTMRRNDHAQVGETSIKIFVAAFEICDGAVLVRFKVRDDEPTSGEIFDEAEAYLDSGVHPLAEARAYRWEFRPATPLPVLTPVRLPS